MNISKDILDLSSKVENEVNDIFANLDDICLYNSEKVLSAFQKEKVSTNDFSEVTGYGYSDPGRDKLERIYADIFKTEDAIVRPQIMSGTHALKVTLFGLLKHGDTMLSISGKPYDTLRSIIGTEGNSNHSLIAHGIKYEEIDLIDNDFDYPSIIDRLSKKDIKLVEIQRSRGYANRKSLTINKIEKVIKEIRKVNKEVIILVDNCYGEFVEKKEPTEVGADVVVSSLMKNLGGGIATSGGYVCGKKDLIFEIAEELNAPTVGKDSGANFNQLLTYYKGLFFAPRVVNSALKTMVFASRLFELSGYKVDPLYNEERTDIIETVELGSEDALVNFCKGLQFGSPIESYVTPIPEETPGYPEKEVMAGGSFTPGSTIELSGDGPVKEPYTCYMQGGLTYEYGKLGIMLALQSIKENK